MMTATNTADLILSNLWDAWEAMPTGPARDRLRDRLWQIEDALDAAS
ncbi:hypothetical protein SEA_DARDANUS_4 [Gordonia phage Dardanus]|uniref:Uncharacterized protein n=1 Tax=Gordonia phage Dardanus TaxID=2588489 RepID=A0A514CX16_9CAUD|nr:hypothetical protein KDJ58_gp04 [Gordonia phage Dardanus]QDH85041.1 hypothetical protein SEA_DARDANUS_4 [Gordonia phage Dardanus]